MQERCWRGLPTRQAVRRCQSTTALFDKVPCSFSRTASAPAARCRAAGKTGLNVVNWNVAAPNNNPFEYWAGHDDESYDSMMTALQQRIDHPGKYDVRIAEIFTQTMYEELRELLCNRQILGDEGLDNIWSQVNQRKILSEFLKDNSFGEKRLISMPDRITGCINNHDGRILFRPSPITGFLGEMGDVQSWWPLWKEFMFDTPFCIRGKAIPDACSMIPIIPRAKYPALSQEEEALSIPLQALCLAIFDAIFTHLLSEVAPETWQPLKRSLHQSLCENKTASCVAILQRQYRTADVIFVQEASDSFAAEAERCLEHMVLRPAGVDGRRSQTSLILARRSTFVEASAREVTEEVLAGLKCACVEAGDLCVFAVDSREDGPFLLASFHGDSNGKATAPVVAAVDALARGRYAGRALLFGLDGNTVSGAATAGSPLSAAGFAAALGERGLASCWGGQDLEGVWTTFNARTYLQPQLQKAVGLSEVLDRRHMQLKDWILFYDAQLAAAAVDRDNTGCRKFRRAVMPSRAFPSDHAIVSVVLRPRRGAAARAADGPARTRDVPAGRSAVLEVLGGAGGVSAALGTLPMFDSRRPSLPIL